MPPSSTPVLTAPSANRPAATRTPILSRYFYTVTALLIIVFAVAGFARTYFFRGSFGTPGELTPVMQVHGALMTLWIVLFAVQSWLIPSRHVAVHRRLGYFGAALAVAIIIAGAVTLVTAQQRTGRMSTIGGGELLLFTSFVTLGILRRKHGPTHKRLMLLANITMFGPGVGRLPIGFLFGGGRTVIFGLIDLFVLACVLFDYRKSGRLHPVFLWGGVTILGSQVFRDPIIKALMSVLFAFT